METITTYGVGSDQPTYNQLREQNRVLRGLLEEIVHDCEHVGSIQHFDKAERRTWVSVANRIKAALTATSQEGQHG